MIMDPEEVKPSRLTALYQESCEIVAILTTSAKKAKANRNQEKGRKGEKG